MIKRAHAKSVFVLAALLLLGGCATMGDGGSRALPDPADAAEAQAWYDKGEFNRAAQAFLQLADTHSADRAHYRLRAAEAQREEGNLDAVAHTLDGIKRRRLADEDALRYDLLQAELALQHHDLQRALTLLALPDANLPVNMRARALELRARAQAQSGDALASARTRATLNRWLGGTDRAQNEAQIVETLRTLTPEALKAQATALPANDALRPWMAQALRKSGQGLSQVIPRPNRPVGTQLPDQQMQREGYRSTRFVALLLPSSGSLKSFAQPVRDGFFSAYFNDQADTRPEIRVYDSGKTAEDAVKAYQQALTDGAERVVGPLTREAVSAIFAQGRLKVPVLALNHPDGGESPPPGSAEFGLLPDAEAAQVAEHMIDRGITHAVAIVANDDWAERAALAFRAQFEQHGGTMLNEARIKDGEVNFSTMIKQAMSGVQAIKSAPRTPSANAPEAAPPDTGLFISMRPQQARLLLPQIKIAGFASVPVFATSHIYSGASNPGQDRDLNGVQFCDAPWLFDATPTSPKRNDIARNLDSVRGGGARLFALGMDAYALLPYLDWLSQHHDSYLPGATGQLTEDALGRIHRLMIWAQFDNGVAHPINGELSMSQAP